MTETDFPMKGSEPVVVGVEGLSIGTSASLTIEGVRRALPVEVRNASGTEAGLRFHSDEAVTAELEALIARLKATFAA